MKNVVGAKFLKTSSAPRPDFLDRLVDWFQFGSRRETAAVYLLLGFVMMVPVFAVTVLFPGLGYLAPWIQIGAAVLGMWFVVIVLAVFMKRFLARLLLRYVSGPDALQRMSWRSLELLTCELYRRMGYKVWHHSRDREADGGIDVEVEKDGRRAVIQCKKYTTDCVGVDKVRELFGVMTSNGADRAILITSSQFSDEAERFAHGKPMELIDHARLWSMVEEVRAEIYVGKLLAPRVVFEDRKPPVCPACGERLVLRKSAKGWLLGCSSYGRSGCSVIVPLEE